MKPAQLTFLLLATILPAASQAHATVQEKDELVFGGRRYAIDQIPMLGIWDYGEGKLPEGKERPPKFDVRSSANWAGYRARWEISDEKLRLDEISGWIGGKPVKNEAILEGRKFPVDAEWFSGRIYLPVGYPDRETSDDTAVIVFHLKKGVVTKMTFLEKTPPVHSWNGLEDEADDSERVPKAEKDSQPDAFPKALREALGKAIGGAIRQGINEVFAKLRISDEVEAGLLSAALAGKTSGSPDAVSIVLLRPADANESSETYQFRNEEKSFRLTMTKIRTKTVTRPTGIVVKTALRDGQISSEESVLHLARDGKWTKNRNGISNEEVERGTLLDEFERRKQRFIR